MPLHISSYKMKQQNWNITFLKPHNIYKQTKIFSCTCTLRKRIQICSHMWNIYFMHSKAWFTLVSKNTKKYPNDVHLPNRLSPTVLVYILLFNKFYCSITPKIIKNWIYRFRSRHPILSFDCVFSCEASSITPDMSHLSFED